MFCIARAYLLQQNVHIPNEYRNVLELKTVSEAFNIINKEKLNSKGNFDDFKKLFQYFLNGIKPLLYSIEAVHLLKNNGYDIYIKSKLEQIFLPEISDLTKSWLPSH